MQALVAEPSVLNLDEMDDDRFFEFCARNSDYRIERTAEGKGVIMPGTGGKTGYRNSGLNAQLWNWNHRARKRGGVFDSSTLFRLPNGAMRSPDAAWISRERMALIPEEQREKWVPLCPEFLVELSSPADRLAQVKLKMDEWMANGCELGWLLT